ncbi:serine hydrolase domain-containing protein [Parafrigoribacterium mesophilum]|uniref:serine hydrolase domain-containing protein n=1 Tax=Parafrigoribacterium mesophilum TaxID=433646 RepID=UPI0031FD03F2
MLDGAAIDRPFLEHSGAAPSSVWAVFDATGVLHWGSTGTLDDGSAPTDTTAYRIASCTKSFTAAAVLSLRDEGQLSLEEPITRFVPEFSAVALPTTDSPVPTIGMLLTMSAGLPTDDPWADRQEAMTDDEFTALLVRGLSFESIPGTRFAYSNLSFALLGRVIERAGGIPYRRFVATRFLRPLRLSSTGFDASVSSSGGLASGYRRCGDGWERLPFSTPGAFSPIGGLFTTAVDLASWARWLAGAFYGDPDAGAPGLSRASRREMQQLHRFAPARGAHPCGYGFGLFVEQYPREGPVVSHSGGYPGFSSHMRWSAASGLGIVAFANATQARVSVPATAAFDALLESRPGSPATLAWPQTEPARRAVTGLIEHWSDEVAGRLFSENVALDDSFEHRRAAIAAAVTAVGGLTGGSEPPDDESAASTASHQVWNLSGATNSLRVEMLLTPENPPRVQTLKVAPAPVKTPAVRA